MIIHFQIFPPVWLLPVPDSYLSPDLLQLGFQGNLPSYLPPFLFSSPPFSVPDSGGVGRRAEHSASSYLAGREFKVTLALEGCFCQLFTEELFDQVDDACPLADHTLSHPLSFWWSISRKGSLHLAGCHFSCVAQGRYSWRLGSWVTPSLSKSANPHFCPLNLPGWHRNLCLGGGPHTKLPKWRHWRISLPSPGEVGRGGYCRHHQVFQRNPLIALTSSPVS